MKKEIFEFHAEFCKTFSNSKRLGILCLLKAGEMTVADITRRLRPPQGKRVTAPGFNANEGILRARRSGINTYYLKAIAILFS